jgi:hypothetical protein
MASRTKKHGITIIIIVIIITADESLHIHPTPACLAEHVLLEE